MKSVNKGFTLIELMVVLIIVALMVAIIIPTYKQYLIKNAESKAKSALLATGLALKKWRHKNFTYANFVPKQGQNVFYIGGSAIETDHNYKIEFIGTSATWRIFAAPNPSSSSVKTAKKYLMLHTGERCYSEASNTSFTKSTTSCESYSQNWK